MLHLPGGLILDIARAADLPFKEKVDKSPLKCPFHEDRHPSAVLIASTNCFYCSVCTPEGGWSAKRLAEALSVDWNAIVRDMRARSAERQAIPERGVADFGPCEAQRTWVAALARARDDEHADEDRAVYDYVAGRRLIEAWEVSMFGIVAPGMPLHCSIEHWPSSGHRLVAPLYDTTGVIANIQGRAITNAKPKTLFPNGSKAAGTLFACHRGLALLRGDIPDREVLLGEAPCARPLLHLRRAWVAHSSGGVKASNGLLALSWRRRRSSC